MRPLFIGFMLCVICPSSAPAQPAGRMAQFVGVWSGSAKGCRLWKQGALDGRPRAEASGYGLTEVTTRGFELLYSAGECHFNLPLEGKVLGRKVNLKATCVFKGHEQPPARVSLAIVAGGKLDLRVNGESWGHDGQVSLMSGNLKSNGLT